MIVYMEKNEKASGNTAKKPRKIPPGGYKQVFKRVLKNFQIDHIPVVSAGIAFYFFLALFPALAAVVSIYGLVMEPAEVQQQIAEISSALPEKTQVLLSDILNGIARKSTGTLGWTLLLGLLISILSANRGTIAVFEGVNIAYKERNERKLLRKYGVTLSFTLGGILVGIISLVFVVGFPALADQLGLSPFIQELINWMRWVILAFIIVISLGVIYHVAPDRRSPEFRWVSWGAIIATILWLGGSLGFSAYVDNLGNYDRMYGSFAAIIILMLWFFLTAIIILLGAEINAEMEHQTREDTTIGKDRPMGERDAFVADNEAKKKNNLN
jgi:membrane protein